MAPGRGLRLPGRPRLPALAGRLAGRRPAREERLRLDQPGVPRRQLRPSHDADAFGRVAELIARYLGTARYLVIQTVFCIVYILLNVIPATTFDGYPFNFLTLLLSLQAAYAAPLILLAQNRQDDRDRANMVEDRQQAVRTLEDTEFLARELAEVRLAIGEVVTRDFLRAELRDLLADALDGTGVSAGPAAPGGQVEVKKRAKSRRKREQREHRAHRHDDADLLVSEPQQPDEPLELEPGEVSVP